MATERYFVGPNLLGDMRETIHRVAGMQTPEGGSLLPGIVLPMMQPSEGGVVRMGKFTGTWTKNSDRIVTLLNSAITPNTVSATNVFVTITGTTVTSTFIKCAIAEDGTAFFVIAAECS